MIIHTCIDYIVNWCKTTTKAMICGVSIDFCSVIHLVDYVRSPPGPNHQELTSCPKERRFCSAEELTSTSLE